MVDQLICGMTPNKMDMSSSKRWTWPMDNDDRPSNFGVLIKQNIIQRIDSRVSPEENMCVILRLSGVSCKWSRLPIWEDGSNLAPTIQLFPR